MMKIKQVIKRILMYKVFYGSNRIKIIGNNVYIPTSIKVLGKGNNVEIGDNVSLGNNPLLMCTNAKIHISNNVLISDNLSIITGDHERRVGTFCNNITEDMKNHNIGLDKDVYIESDVWIGINVTILKGVTINRGCTISAGSLVNKSMPPYSICGGIPCKFIKFYWTIDQILEHESKLYPKNKRYTKSQLEEIYNNYNVFQVNK